MTSIMRFDKWENSIGSQSVTFNQLKGGTGLVPMIPTTVQYSGGTATSNTAGIITYNAVTSLSLNGVFGSYKNYRMIITGTSTNNTALLGRFRQNGVDLTSAVNQRQVLYANGTAVSAGRGSNESNWEIGVLDVNHQTILDIYSPNLNTFKRGLAISGRGTTTIQWFTESLVCTDTNAYDSFTIYPNGGTISGEVVVYGYNELVA